MLANGESTIEITALIAPNNCHQIKSKSPMISFNTIAIIIVNKTSLVLMERNGLHLSLHSQVQSLDTFN